MVLGIRVLIFCFNNTCHFFNSNNILKLKYNSLHMPKRKRVRLTDKQIHKYVKDQIDKSVDLSTTHWVKCKTSVTPTGHSLGRLYDLVRRRNYFDYGGWYEYLVGHHKVSSLSKRYMPDERIHSYIKMQIDNGVKLNSLHWQKGDKKVTPVGQTLNALHLLVRRKNYFEHDNWNAYIKWLKENYEN